MKARASIVAAGIVLRVFTGFAEAPDGPEKHELPVEAEVTVGIDSSQLKYGLPENDEPVLSIEAELTLLHWLYIGIEDIHDLTPYGREAGYGNRAGEYRELCPSAGLTHSFGPVELSAGYQYERHPPCIEEDTHFATASVSLPDLPLSPWLEFERDLCRDNGMYLRLGLEHTVDITTRIALRMAVTQGLGTSRRTSAVLEDFSRGGLMDTCLSGRLSYRITEHLSVGCYALFTDYLLDAGTHDAVEGESWRFAGGAFATFGF